MQDVSLIARTPSAYAYPLLIKQLLHTPLAAYPEQEIIYSNKRRYNYWTMRHRIGQLASGLAGLGVEPGDTVAMMDWDSHRYLETYFAVPMMGAVLMTVNVRLSPDQIAYTLNHSRTKVLIFNSEFLPVVEAIRPRLETVSQFVLIDEAAELAERPEWVLAQDYEEFVGAASPDFVFPDFSEDARATTFYTTGTTGLPKGVYFSHRQLVLHTLSFALGLTSAAGQGRVHREDVYMPITPMFHVHAWGAPYVATLLGMRQIYPGRYTPEHLLNLIKTEKVTFSHCVPTLLQMLLSNPAAKDVDLSGWKVMIGGSALPRGLAEAALDRGIDVFAGYGMSETGPVLTVSQLKPPLRGTRSRELDVRAKAGLPLPLVDLRVVDDNMKDVAHDGKASGEVVVRAPWTTQGYFENEQASEALWQGGYLHTNDMGAIDGDGYLQITDRIKDVIKTGGEWVSSLEIEDLISRHAAVSEAAVFGVKDDKWGERPMALVVLKPGAKIDGTAIRSHLGAFSNAGLIPKYAVPERVEIVDAIDKTSVGKINKRVLREKYQRA